MDHLYAKCGDLLWFYGYAKLNEEDQEGKYVMKDATPQQKELHQQYRRTNLEMVKYSAENHELIENTLFEFKNECINEEMLRSSTLKEAIQPLQKKIII
mmetsp:Transcript_14949/g.14542  ORF Transcript_14949/g.14542 Transcript_14949/m.14542 type:complete len:99 (+) Transcript_14949:296-592(+)|eukprot:CAMPEP_0170548780 /NCGR_PEP_ID=MMETSP0211-20121228/6976_1 /TAXON_ID=311385 /ORGANISM="Pseudokeronopsis sp., Strain OXSARD2" /LENGTH=98 /DNA_ID=CAMNT_0010854413 /DNA_START=985 /DNA_END=1281 /DNA_ORIENTATION=-